MGNHSRFRVSDIIPNASWFSKLKSMSIRAAKPKHSSKHVHHHHPPPSSSSPSSTVSTLLSSSSSSSSSCKTGFQHHHRKSYYFTRDLINDPSSKLKQSSSPSIRGPTTARYKSHHLLPTSSTRVSSGCSCRSSATIESCVSSKKQPPGSIYPNPAPEITASSSSHSSDVDSIVPEISCSSATSPVLSRSSSISSTDKPDYINMQEKENNVTSARLSGHQNHKQPDHFGSACENFRLPPIRTTSDRDRSPPGKAEPTSRTRLPSNSPQGGVKLRSKSPRVIGVSKRMRIKRRKSLSESFAVVKASRDPGRDFRESMVEMIVENNIKGSRELEDLLACYLSLNSENYHELIISVFKQIWFDLNVQV